ncbi:MAG: sulfite exporter TauE/SafE family protein [Phycisphaerales bacterium]
MDQITLLIGAVFAASVLGSLHCAGMCGAFLLFAVGADREPSRGEQLRLHVAYHGGRLLTYTCLGTIAGAVGAALDLGGSMVGVQRVAAGVAGALMIAYGVFTLARLRGVRIKLDLVPSRFRRVVELGQRRALGMAPVPRALLIGLLTTLLPCGWLYAFAITAAGTGRPELGALTMAVFWLGTLPVLISLGVGAQALAGPLRRHLPMLTSLALVGVGLYMVVARVTAPIIRQSDLGLMTSTSLHDPTGGVPDPDAFTCPLCEPDGD